MILLIGGHGAGKRDYIRALGYGDEAVAEGVLDGRPVLHGLEQLTMADPDGAAALLEPLCAKELVACDEVGSGVIPLERRDRDGREATGRLCVLLAQRAERVIRLVAGVPLVIK